MGNKSEDEVELSPPVHQPKQMSDTLKASVEKAIIRNGGKTINPRLEKMIREEAARGVLGSTLGDAAGKLCEGGKMNIELKDNKNDFNQYIRPCHVTTARAVPLHYKEPAANLVKELIDSKVMIREPNPTEWCSPAHFVPKPSGKVRLVIDYRRLNEATLRRCTHSRAYRT